MRRILIALLFACGLASAAVAQERLTLTAPVSTTRSTVRLTRMIVDYETQAVTVEWASNVTTEAFSVTYNATTARTGASLITTLNTMNFSGANPSLFKRTMQLLQTDGFLPAGTYTGTPQ